MDMNKRPVCSLCNVCKRRCNFTEVIDVKGIKIYKYDSSLDRENYEHFENSDGDWNFSYILHNTRDIPIHSQDIQSPINEAAINCPRCKAILQHAKKLLTRIPTIGKNVVIGICDHCKIQQSLIKTCKKCVHIIKQFSDRKEVDYDMKKQTIMPWLSTIQKAIQNELIKSKQTCVHTSPAPRSKSKDLAHQLIIDERHGFDPANSPRQGQIKFTCTSCESRCIAPLFDLELPNLINYEIREQKPTKSRPDFAEFAKKHKVSIQEPEAIEIKERQKWPLLNHPEESSVSVPRHSEIFHEPLKWPTRTSLKNNLNHNLIEAPEHHSDEYFSKIVDSGQQFQYIFPGVKEKKVSQPQISSSQLIKETVKRFEENNKIHKIEWWLKQKAAKNNSETLSYKSRVEKSSLDRKGSLTDYDKLDKAYKAERIGKDEKKVRPKETAEFEPHGRMKKSFKLESRNAGKDGQKDTSGMLEKDLNGAKHGRGDGKEKKDNGAKEIDVQKSDRDDQKEKDDKKGKSKEVSDQRKDQTHKEKSVKVKKVGKEEGNQKPGQTQKDEKIEKTGNDGTDVEGRYIDRHHKEDMYENDEKNCKKEQSGKQDKVEKEKKSRGKEFKSGKCDQEDNGVEKAVKEVGDRNTKPPQKDENIGKTGKVKTEGEGRKIDRQHTEDKDNTLEKRNKTVQGEKEDQVDKDEQHGKVDKYKKGDKGNDRKNNYKGGHFEKEGREMNDKDHKADTIDKSHKEQKGGKITKDSEQVKRDKDDKSSNLLNMRDKIGNNEENGRDESSRKLAKTRKEQVGSKDATKSKQSPSIAETKETTKTPTQIIEVEYSDDMISGSEDVLGNFTGVVNRPQEIIVGTNMYKYTKELEAILEKKETDIPTLYHITAENNGQASPELKKTANSNEKVNGTDERKGGISYALSDRNFVEKGWTLLPTEKVVRKMNVFRMSPVQLNWFELNKDRGTQYYDTGERLAEFENNKTARWYYRSGRTALQYYEAEEVNAQQRVVVYSNGEPDKSGRNYPVTILACFDYLGNGIVFDHAGKIRMKYNQTEGVVLDRTLGPDIQWKWHSLNDPPILQQVMIDNELPIKDDTIMGLNSPSRNRQNPDDDQILAIEYDNSIKEKQKKAAKKFKPFQIKMKAMKLNDNFSLRVLNQASVYLQFHDGATHLKVNLGMLLDNKEILDSESVEVGYLNNPMQKLPAKSDSLAKMQYCLTVNQKGERERVERKLRIRPDLSVATVDILHSAASRKLRSPYPQVSSTHTATRMDTEVNSQCHSRKAYTCNMFYENQLV